jgi:3-methyladenine DNA glycosylase AlkD
MNKYEELKSLFEKTQNEESAIAMAKYMRDLFLFYGVPANQRKEITKPFIAEAKAKKVIDWELLDLCYPDPHREMQYFVNDYLVAMSKYLTYDDIPHLLKYVKAKQWWDTIDFLDKIIGNIGLKDHRVDELMLKWSQDEDIWLRRLAIDHQNSRKDLTNPELLEKIIVNNFGTDEFFINKAIGWSLRDYSKVNPNWVRSFINKFEKRMDKLSIKEASKYL